MSSSHAARADKKEILTGAQAVMRSLEDEGVRVVFGLPGGSVLPLYDAIAESSIQHILVRHEQAAAHAADGYSRAGFLSNLSQSATRRELTDQATRRELTDQATRRELTEKKGDPGVGVCIATSGPGAMNLVMGLATACHDSVPLIAITGQVATSVIGTDYFQEAHTLGIAMPVVKHCMQARRPADIPIMIHDALRIACTGRPGPVLIDLPVDVQMARCEYVRPRGTFFPEFKPVVNSEPAQSESEIKKAAGIIREAKRPIIIAGNGINISGAWRELRDFAEGLGIPVAVSLLGKGVISSDSPCSIGMIGVHGLEPANRALIAADLVIAVGTRFSNRSTGLSSSFAGRNVIHIDIDRAEIRKNINASVPLVGDARQILRALIEAVGDAGKAGDSDERREWLKTARGTRDNKKGESPDIILPRAIFDELADLTGGRAVVTTEVGQHQMWAAQYLPVRGEGRFITSGGQGSMGFGIPAAMGASLARGGQPVICIAGDGSAMMNIQELETFARYNIPVKTIVLDNCALGMVRQLQEFCLDSPRVSQSVYPSSPDFAGIARAMGVEAFSASRPEELRPALESALLKAPGPALVHIKIPQEENVLPMVPGNMPLDKMIV